MKTKPYRPLKRVPPESEALREKVRPHLWAGGRHPAPRKEPQSLTSFAHPETMKMALWGAFFLAKAQRRGVFRGRPSLHLCGFARESPLAA